jgi:hypothetical protein
MGDLEGIGDAVTGTLLARAVEPTAGEISDDGHTHEKSCLNCGTKLTGPFCSACGQKAHVHRSLRAFFQDFLAGLLNFEGKFWRTLPMLAWHPGELTRRYIAGERARFISPVALYLFTVFAMFAALNLSGTFSPEGLAVGARNGLEESIKDNQRSLTRLEGERKTATGDEAKSLDRRIANRKRDIAEAQQALASGKAFVAGEVDETPSWIQPFIENARENPEVVALKVQEATSKYSWMLIPLSIPFMWMLFPFSRRYRAYDHTVFVTYSLSFMMMLVVVSSMLIAAGFTTLATFLFFVPPIHMYRQLKGAYELGKWSAIFRTTLLVGFACAAGGIFMTTAVAIGLS